VPDPLTAMTLLDQAIELQKNVLVSKPMNEDLLQSTPANKVYNKNEYFYLIFPLLGCGHLLG
jgi:hypothetical protein